MVERVAEGLLKGYVDRLAPYDNAHDVSVSAWIEVCRNAYRLWRDPERWGRLGPDPRPAMANLLDASSDFEGGRWQGLSDAANGVVPPAAVPSENVMCHLLPAADVTFAGDVGGGVAAPNPVAHELYTVSTLVWVPGAFRGSAVSVLIGGQPSIRLVGADMARRDCWQRVWASAAAPEGALHLYPSLYLAGDRGSFIFSTAWKMERGDFFQDDPVIETPVVADPPPPPRSASVAGFDEGRDRHESGILAMLKRIARFFRGRRATTSSNAPSPPIEAVFVGATAKAIRRPNLIPAGRLGGGASWFTASHGRVDRPPPPLHPGCRVMTHGVGETAPANLFGSLVEGVVKPGTIYVASAWVWLPSGFGGSDVGLVIDAVDSLHLSNADEETRDQWQRVWASARIPPARAGVLVALNAMAPAGDIFFSTCWKLEEGAAPTAYEQDTVAAGRS